MQELDLTGLKCPLPVLRTRKSLSSMTAGEVIAVISTDPMSVIDMPHFCKEHGHKLLESPEHPSETMRFVIQKA